MEAIAKKLKQIIGRDGPARLSDKPCEIFQELVQEPDIDRIKAGAVLYTLVCGIPDLIADAKGQCEISIRIAETCGLTKELADELSVMYSSLFSGNDGLTWAKPMDGYKQFLKTDFSLAWEGSSVWSSDGGSVSCTYEAQITLRCGPGFKDESLQKSLKDNPYQTDKEIWERFGEELKTYLDREFDFYCSDDDYYPPVVEDYELEAVVEDWCKERGFELVSVEGGGSTGDFESDYGY